MYQFVEMNLNADYVCPLILSHISLCCKVWIGEMNNVFSSTFCHFQHPCITRTILALALHMEKIKI